MKKSLLLLAVIMISANSFAWKGTFTTSCGIIVAINNPNVNTVSEVVSFLQTTNGRFCGNSNVVITFR